MRLSATPRVLVGALMVAVLAVTAGCGGREPEQGPEIPPLVTRSWEPPPGFEPLPIPADNPMTTEKVALGAQLFFDPRISGDGARSCYSCHLCDKGMADGAPTAAGAFGATLERSSPPLWNIGYHTTLDWDGRYDSLEDQALWALTGPIMGANADSIATALNAIPAYKAQFQKVFNTEVTAEAIVKALAAFQRTLFCGNTAFDRFQQGETDAIPQAAKQGWELFKGKAGCATCHKPPLFTDLKYHNVGVDMDKTDYNPGRFAVTQDAKDTAAFKTPTLRDITRTAPYFHNGRVGTLNEAVRYMLSGGIKNPHLDPNLKGVVLTDQEIGQLLAFLQTLECTCDIEAPTLP